MSKYDYKNDIVGSFLRPEVLKTARKNFEEGKIQKEELTRIEDECIKDLIAKQKEVGIHVITDGEFRRATWHLDFMWGFEGVDHCKTTTGLPFNDEVALVDDTCIVGKVALNGEHPFIEHFKFVQSFEDENTVAKQTIPSPAQVLAQFTMPFNRLKTKHFYENDQDLIDDLVAAFNKFVNDLYDAGCRILQLDDCTWGMLSDFSAATRIYNTDANGLKAIQETYKDINNRVIDAAPKDLEINTHICRGNYHSTFACSGAYDPVADVLFGGENVNKYYLEFDDERSGGFESLSKISGDKKVVLGLITTKFPELEDKETVKERIRLATKYIPLERLSLSPQCGFASCEIGNKLTEEEQWDKLRLVKEIADEVWG